MAQLKDLIVNGDAKFLADVILDHDPTADLHAATKHYVDTAAGSASDEKLKVGALTSGTAYLPILAITTDTGTALTRQIDKNAEAFKYVCTPGSANVEGTATLTLGNSKLTSQEYNATGVLEIYGNSIYSAKLKYSAAYAGQTVYLPTPTANDETSYLLSKLVSGAVGAVDQPVYVNAQGRVETANKNPWIVSSLGGMATPATVNTTNNTIKNGAIASITLNGINSSDVSGIVVDESNLFINYGNYLTLNSTTAAGGTTYEIASRYVGTLELKSAEYFKDIYFVTSEVTAAQKPTSVSFNSTTNVATLTFSSSLNPNNSTNKIWQVSNSNAKAAILVGAGISAKDKHNCILVGSSLVNSNYEDLLIGQCMENSGYEDLLVGSRIKNTGNRVLVVANQVHNTANMVLGIGTGLINSGTGSAIIGTGHRNSASYAFMAGQWHDSTNGSEGVAAVGKYSTITSTSAFVVGNGTADDARSNAFEVTTTGTAKVTGLQIGAASEIKSIGTGLAIDANGALYATGGGSGTITGGGISGYLAKWTGTSGQTSTELTAGPAIGTGIKQFLREDGNWAKPFASQIYMGWCDTARATAAKTVTLDSSFELVADTMIMIRFANGNSAATPTLNINSLGAKNITFNSQSLNNSVLPSAMAPNTYLILQYTGSSWTVMSGYNNYVLMSPYMYNVDRVTSLNRSYSQPVVEYLLATSATTTGKPPVDAHVLSLNWDNSNNYTAQLAVANGSSVVATPGRIFSRGQFGTTTTWSDWLEVPRLSGALTNNQIVVSDESTGTALLKGGPTIGTGTTEFLREDGTWAVPTRFSCDLTYYITSQGASVSGNTATLVQGDVDQILQDFLNHKYMYLTETGADLGYSHYYYTPESIGQSSSHYVGSFVTPVSDDQMYCQFYFDGTDDTVSWFEYSIGGGGGGTVDSTRSTTSTNALQNKVITNFTQTLPLPVYSTAGASPTSAITCMVNSNSIVGDKIITQDGWIGTISTITNVGGFYSASATITGTNWMAPRKVTVGTTQYTITRKALEIVDGSTTTTYYVADIT